MASPCPLRRCGSTAMPRTVRCGSVWRQVSNHLILRRLLTRLCPALAANVGALVTAAVTAEVRAKFVPVRKL